MVFREPTCQRIVLASKEQGASWKDFDAHGISLEGEDVSDEQFGAATGALIERLRSEGYRVFYVTKPQYVVDDFLA